MKQEILNDIRKVMRAIKALESTGTEEEDFILKALKSLNEAMSAVEWSIKREDYKE